MDIVKGARQGSVTSFLGSLRDQDVWGLRPALDPVENGLYTTTGIGAMVFDLSVGAGKGSSKILIEATDFIEVTAYLKAFDPDQELGEVELSPLECVKRTLEATDTEVSFKVSLAKHSRKVTIPRAQWAGFVALSEEWLADLTSGPDADGVLQPGPAIERCRAQVRDALAKEAELRNKLKRG